MRRYVATLFFVQIRNAINGSLVTAGTNVSAQIPSTRRNLGACDCPKCGQKCWHTETAAGTEFYKCQGCGKSWMDGCTHPREIRYVTAGGVDMLRCTTCGKRRKLPVPKPKL